MRTTFAARPDGTPIVFSRRTLLVGAAALGFGSLAGCKETEALASASRNDERTYFTDAVGWVEDGGSKAVIAFTPFAMSDDDRNRVIQARGVFPALASREPMIEMRLEVQPAKADKLSATNLSAVELTFWHFEETAAVVRETGPWSEQAEVGVVGLSGEIRAGGWVVGTIRGQRLVPSQLNARETSYTWNLAMQLSLAG